MFELDSEFIGQNNLTEEQVAAITSNVSNSFADFKKTTEESFKGVANDNAEQILKGAASAFVAKTGLQIERQQGEKYADFFDRGSKAYFESKEKDYQEKFKNLESNEGLKGEVEQLRTEKDTLLKKYADYDELKTKSSEYDSYKEENTKLTIDSAFSDAKPSFPDTANPYEVSSKYDNFKNRVLKEWDIKKLEGKWTLINKENIHKTMLLTEAVAKDKEISELANKKTVGSGTEFVEKTVEVEGYGKFSAKAKTDSSVRASEIRDFLKEQGLNPMSDAYAKKFAELNIKIAKG